MISVIAVLIAHTDQTVRTTALTNDTQEVEDPRKLSIPSQETIELPDNLRGPDISSDDSRQTYICDNSLDVTSNVNSFIDNNVTTQTDTEIVYIGRKSQNECAVMVNTG